MTALLVVWLGVVGMAAQNPAIDPADLDVAARHFATARAHYEAGRFEEAISEFRLAKEVSPQPEFDYNIARAYDHMGRAVEAIANYRRYLDSRPAEESRAEVERRITTLEARLQKRASAPRPRFVLPGVLTGVTLAIAGVGGGLLGSAVVEYNTLADGCGRTHACARTEWADLPARDYAGKALLGVAGALLIVDVALFVRASRRPGRALAHAGTVRW